nr:immunoglobulin heavy chain junction region [Macaca mulatta]
CVKDAYGRGFDSW